MIGFACRSLVRRQVELRFTFSIEGMIMLRFIRNIFNLSMEPACLSHFVFYCIHGSACRRLMAPDT
jgi:hypothetical protein